MTLTITPIAVDAPTAAEMLGQMAKSTFLARVARGELPRPRRLGGRSMWLVEDLLAAARALPVSDDTPAPKRQPAA